MILMSRFIFTSFMLVFLLTGCSSKHVDELPAMAKNETAEAMVDTPSVKAVKKERLSLGSEHIQKHHDDIYAGKMYSFQAHSIPVRDALSMFAKAYHLSVIVDEDVQGEVDISFSNLNFTQSMDALLNPLDLYWMYKKGVVYVKDVHTKVFQLNYIRMSRSGSASSQAQVASSGGGGSGSTAISNKVEVQFWKELEKQLAVLISDQGRLVVNRLSGTIQVTDHHKYIKEVESFVQDIQSAMHRQVEIEAKIIEVNLNDNSNLGIDWNRIASSGLVKLNTALATAASGTLSTVNLTLQGRGKGTDKVSAVISALKEQGNIRVVSQPRLLMLNNQSALIKVGTEQPFFSQTTTPGTGGSAPTVTEEVKVVTIGLVLAVTAQIASDDWVMLDASPMITRLVGTATSKLGSSAPILDVKQASTLIRLRDGETVVIGGLIQDEHNTNVRKVPLLGDVPVVGTFFKGDYKQKKRSELVIFLTPKIRRDKSKLKEVY